MNTEAIKKEVKQVIIALEAIARAPYALTGFYGVNYSLEACQIASKITGANETICKMLNLKFRTDAANMMFERALEQVHA